MTRVSFCREGASCRFSCVGHAFDERVCAAASALCMALTGRLETLEEAGQAVIEEAAAVPGELRLTFRAPLGEDLPGVLAAVETVLAGFLAVERLYPGELEVE